MGTKEDLKESEKRKRKKMERRKEKWKRKEIPFLCLVDILEE